MDKNHEGYNQHAGLNHDHELQIYKYLFRETRVLLIFFLYKTGITLLS